MKRKSHDEMIEQRERAQRFSGLAVVGKGGIERNFCGYCEKPKADTFIVNPRQRKSHVRLCEDCHRSVRDEAIRKYQLQLDAGVPDGQRYIEWPVDFFPFMWSRWQEEIRYLMMAMDYKLAPVRTGKPAKTA